jgi:hypothetical protein
VPILGVVARKTASVGVQLHDGLDDVLDWILDDAGPFLVPVSFSSHHHLLLPLLLLQAASVLDRMSLERRDATRIGVLLAGVLVGCILITLLLVAEQAHERKHGHIHRVLEEAELGQTIQSLRVLLSKVSYCLSTSSVLDTQTRAHGHNRRDNSSTTLNLEMRPN